MPDLSRVAENNWYGGTYSGASTYAFNDPFGMAFDGTHLWTANAAGNSVTEINASNGAWIRTLSAATYKFNGPYSITFDGTHLWVTNTQGSTTDSITEIDPSDGSFIRNLSGDLYGFDAPEGMAFDGHHLWVVNANANTVTELDPADGSLVQTISDPADDLNIPQSILFDGSHLWIGNQDSLTELSEDGSLVRTVTGDSYDFDNARQMVFDGTNLWVLSGNETPSSGNDNFPVIEVSAADGSLVRKVSIPIPNPTDTSPDSLTPWGLAFDGSHIWVSERAANAVAEIDTNDGTIIKTLTAAAYGFNYPMRMTFDGTHIWVGDDGGPNRDTITDIDLGP